MNKENYNLMFKSLKSMGFCLLLTLFSAQIMTAQNNISRAMAGSAGEIQSIKSGKQSISPEVVLAPATASFTEGFDGGVVPAGWSVQNLSSPVGTNTNCWNIFGTTPWAPQAGAGHIGANFNCTAGAGTISGWLFSPVILFNNGDQIKFWTRKTDASTDFPDRLELRLSTNNTSTNVGATATSVGDFTTLLLSVNPTLTTGVYPTTFTQFTATISGLPASVNGRVAFRYFVTNGGPAGANSDIISIDTFDYVMAPTAADGLISGRVVNLKGRGIARATVQMIDQNGNVRTAITNPFGFYRFDDVSTGDNYIFNVFAKNYRFNSQVLNVLNNLQELNFTAQQ